MKEHAVQLLIDDNGQIRRWGFDTKAADFFWMWSWGNGGDLLNEDGREATFATPENVEALQYNLDVYEAQGGFANFQAFIQTTGFDGAENFFVQSQVAMTPFENWLLGIVAQGDPEHEFSVVPFQGRDGTPYSMTGGQSWAIPAGAQNRDAAWEWMSYFSSPIIWRDTSVQMKERLETDGRLYTPALTASNTANQVLNSEVFTGTGSEWFDNAIRLFPDLLDANTASAASPVLSELNDILRNSVVLPALNGERSPEDALNDGQSMAQRALDDFFR